MKTGECKYCKKPIEQGCIRCSDCDYAWQDGYEHGKEVSKLDKKECFNKIMSLFQED